jgi:predicted ester cyclase
MRGPTGYLAVIAMMRGGFPDIQWTLEEMIAEEDKVAARFTMRGTHDGAFFGVPPTGEKIAVQAMNSTVSPTGKSSENAASQIC